MFLQNLRSKTCDFTLCDLESQRFFCDFAIFGTLSWKRGGDGTGGNFHTSTGWRAFFKNVSAHLMIFLENNQYHSCRWFSPPIKIFGGTRPHNCPLQGSCVLFVRAKFALSYIVTLVRAKFYTPPPPHNP